MSLPGTFKKLLALAGGTTAAVFSVNYTGQLYKMNYQIDEADAFTIRQVNKAYAELQKDENDSLLKKNLSPSLLRKLEGRKTKLGASLCDIIQSGLARHDSVVGVYAADAESYHKFAPLFDKIIEDYHGFRPRDKQPAVDLGEGKTGEFTPLDPDRKYIKSTRIQCARSVAGYPFSSLLTADDYLIMEQKVRNALEKIEDPELRGKYSSLDDELKKTSNGRGTFHNKNNTFSVSVNEEDHLCIVSMDEGSDVGKVLDRLIRGLKALEKTLKFARDDRLGWLTCSPGNLGSAVSATVQIHLPKLLKRADFKELCDKLNLRVSPAAAGSADDSCLISNKATLGLSQYEAVKQMYDGVKELIRMEEKS